MYLGSLPLDILIASQMDNALDTIGLEKAWYPDTNKVYLRRKNALIKEKFIKNEIVLNDWKCEICRKNQK